MIRDRFGIGYHKERKDEQTVFSRLSNGELQEWLDDYTLSELWQKNILGGRPR